MGNTDLHAKNLALLHDDGVQLAPMYDVVSTAAYPAVDQELGLRVAGEYHLADVGRDALVAEGVGWGMGERAATSAVTVIAAAVADLVGQVAVEIAEVGFDAPVLAGVARHIGQRAAGIARPG